MIYAGYCTPKGKRVAAVLLVSDGGRWLELARGTANAPFDAMQATGGLYDRRPEPGPGDTFDWAGLVSADEAAARWPTA